MTRQPYLVNLFFVISTHTLTWSVTRYSSFNLFPYEHFNSHAHVERDFLSLCLYTAVENFNSHAHVERDILGVYLSFLPVISTHTLTWSVTS